MEVAAPDVPSLQTAKGSVVLRNQRRIVPAGSSARDASKAAVCWTPAGCAGRRSATTSAAVSSSASSGGVGDRHRGTAAQQLLSHIWLAQQHTRDTWQCAAASAATDRLLGMPATTAATLLQHVA